MNTSPSSRTASLRPRQNVYAAVNRTLNDLRHQFLVDEQWDEWAARPAPGENRLAAVSAVRACVENRGSSLDLSSLGLEELPPVFPSHIQHLDVSVNKIHVLPAVLPQALKTLNASRNQLRSLPTRLPDSIEHLYVANNKLTEIP